MIGAIAKEYCKKHLPVQVCRKGHVWVIGTWQEDVGLVSVESEEVYPTASLAERALKEGSWNQRLFP